MTKADIVNEITKNTGIDKVTVLPTLEAFMDTVKDSLSKEANVYPVSYTHLVSSNSNKNAPSLQC